MPDSSHGRRQAPATPGAIPHTLSDFPCVDFVNSRFAEHTGTGRIFDRLDLAEWQLWFARRCGVALEHPPTGAMRRRLIDLRVLLRDLLESARPPDTRALADLNAVLAAPSPVLRLSNVTDGVDLTPSWRHQDWAAVMAATVISYAELSRSGSIDRVKVCASPHCTYVFYDETRNGSRRFCDARLCGTLSRVRRHRAHAVAVAAPGRSVRAATDTPSARSR